MKEKQTSFWKAPPKEHGGEKSKGRAKTFRPIATKRPMHLILRSSRAKGEWSFRSSRHADRVSAHLQKTARRFNVKIHRFANTGNHFHLIVQVKRREDFQNFLRVFAQGVVFLVTGARKGNPVGKFWDALAFSRIIEWGRDFINMKNYLEKNRLEGNGIPRYVVDWWFGEYAREAAGVG